MPDKRLSIYLMLSPFLLSGSDGTGLLRKSVLYTVTHLTANPGLGPLLRKSQREAFKLLGSNSKSK